MADSKADLSLVTAYCELAVEKFDPGYELPAVKIRHCPDIDADRKGDKSHKRYYAHVDHYKDTICFAAAVGKLSPAKQAGLVLHEIGHLLDDVVAAQPSAHELKKAEAIYEEARVDEEAAANQAIFDALGIEILYGKDEVQRISKEDLEWLEHHR